MSNLIDESLTKSIDPAKNYHEELVGEGKKYVDDQALARSKVEADNFIERLQTELKEVREDLRGRLSMEDLVKELRKQDSNTNRGNSSNPGHTPSLDENEPNKDGTNESKLTQKDVEDMVESRLKEREFQRTRQQNIEQVKKVISEKWGRDAASKLQQVAQDLEMSVEELDNFAANRPKAFMKAAGLDGSSESPRQTSESHLSLFTGGELNSQPVTSKNAGQRDYKYYQKIRKENPGLYHSPSVQKEMMENARKLGDSFFTD